MSPKPAARPHGQIRQSQIVTTFGPGAPLDLPDYSVLVSGLDFWSGVDQEVHEPRLIEKLKRLLDAPSLKLYLPPRDKDDPTAPRTGVTVWQFPEWFITQDVEEGSRQGRFIRSRMLVPRKALTRGKFIDLDRRKRHVVPIRFVRACRRGHIGDIDWYGFIHKDPMTKCRRQLWIDERGTSGDLADVFARCDCNARRSLGEAAILSNQRENAVGDHVTTRAGIVRIGVEPELCLGVGSTRRRDQQSHRHKENDRQMATESTPRTF